MDCMFYTILAALSAFHCSETHPRTRKTNEISNICATMRVEKNKWARLFHETRVTPLKNPGSVIMSF